MKWIKGFLINIQFLTAIPLTIELPMDHAHIRKAVQTFPLLGLFQGVVYAVLLWGLNEWTPFSVLAIAFIIWLVTILISGGIHLDGWMDASDAYFSYRDIEKRLEIMTDPRTGAFGVISIILLLSSRFLFIYEIITMMKPETYFLIALLPFFSKAVMGGILLSVKAAKNEGLGAFFQASAKLSNLWIYAVYFLIIFIVFININVMMVMILFVASITCYLFLRRKIVKWFGGITGDVVGATAEGTELMLWMTLWLLHYFVMG